MNSGPFRRRYGHGAARLPIGMPPGVHSLSALSRGRADAEGAIAALPVLFLIVLSLSFGVAIRLAAVRDPGSAPLAAMTEIRELELAFFEEAPIAAPVPSRSVPRPQTGPDPAPTTTPAAPPIPPGTPSDRHEPFDPAQLVMKPVPQPITLSGSEAIQRRVRVPERPSARQMAMPASTLAIAGLSRPTPPAEGLEAVSTRPHPQRPLRPVRAAVAPSDPALLPEWPVGGTGRRAFLADVEAFEARHPDVARALAERPPVAAASPASSRPALRTLRSAPSEAHARAGWSEIPLDDLPDCMPPGRQDLLKKRILLAAPSGRECSHRDGSYRFVETRNLGAFLMWSRTRPGRPADRKPIRNACDVLEQALRCLDESSTKEFNSR